LFLFCFFVVFFLFWSKKGSLNFISLDLNSICNCQQKGLLD